VKLFLKGLFVALGATACSTATADWTGGIEAGTALGSGDRPTVRFYANNRATPLSQYLYLDWIRESGSSNYRIGYDPTWSISQSVYSFGRFSVEKDGPDSIEREIDALVGIGNRLFQRGSTQVKVEAGIGAQYLRYDETALLDPITGESVSPSSATDGFFFATGNIRSSLLALLKFDASLQAKSGSGLNILDGEVGLSIPIGPGTALRYVHQYKYNDSLDDKTSDDSFFKVTYGF